jgi:NAD(P)-dependent dehydrogenase (short-subunit alcohol dehydrogenase family)
VTVNANSEPGEGGRLSGKAAIVTGGARGIGRGIAEVFAEAGAAVAIIDRDGDAGSATASELGLRFAEGDVSDESSVVTAVDGLVSELGGLDILVNNAAVFVLKGLEATVEDWQQVMAVNIMGPALVTKHAVPHIRRAGGGAIVNVGSVSSFIAQPGMLTYNATKAAIAEMSRCLALDLAEDGIRVNTVCPGATWSSQVQRIAAERGLTREQAALEPNLGAEQIIKRIADPREIGYAALFLASGEASFVTGAHLMVDGGWTAL